MTIYRYQEMGSQYSLQTFSHAAYTPLQAQSVTHGTISDVPQWLVPIIAISKMSNRGIQVLFPPPDFIVWFSTAPDGAFEEFIDVTQAG